MLYLSRRLKKILILFIVFTLTGCTAEYNLTINDTKDVIESLNVVETNKELFEKKYEELSGSSPKEYLETNLKWPTPVDYNTETNPLEPTKIQGASYYNKKNISTSLKLGINYNYNFTSSNYKNSNILNSCYDYKYDIIKDVVTFKTEGDIKCFDEYPLLEEVHFNLKTTCHVINSNADVKGNERYTWKIKKDNKKSINFSIDCGKKKNIKVPFAIMVPIYIVLVGIGILILKISYRINNRF